MAVFHLVHELLYCAFCVFLLKGQRLETVCDRPFKTSILYKCAYVFVSLLFYISVVIKKILKARKVLAFNL